MLLFVKDNRLAYISMKNYTRGTNTAVFLDAFAVGSNGEKNWGDSFSVQCVYKEKTFLRDFFFFSFQLVRTLYTSKL